jgi:hypothetical protein
MPCYLHFEYPENFEIRLSHKTGNIYMSKSMANYNDNQSKSKTINQKTRIHELAEQKYNKKSVSMPKFLLDSKSTQTIATKTKSL